VVGCFVLGMPSRHTNNFPESGRGLGHVNPTIFGSTVGYPSDSLASCSVKTLAMANLRLSAVGLRPCLRHSQYIHVTYTTDRR